MSRLANGRRDGHAGQGRSRGPEPIAVAFPGVVAWAFSERGLLVHVTSRPQVATNLDHACHVERDIDVSFDAANFRGPEDVHTRYLRAIFEHNDDAVDAVALSLHPRETLLNRGREDSVV